MTTLGIQVDDCPLSTDLATQLLVLPGITSAWTSPHAGA